MATKFTKDQLAKQLLDLGYECIAPSKTLKQKFEDALDNLKKGKEPGKDFKKKEGVSSSSAVTPKEVVTPSTPNEVAPPTPSSTTADAKPVKKIIKKKTVEPTPTPVEPTPTPTPVEPTPTLTPTPVEPTPTPTPTNVVKEFDALMSQKTPSAPAPAPSLPVPQKRVEHTLLTGTISIKSEDLVKILESASSLSSDDYTNILKALSSYCGTASPGVATPTGNIPDVVLKTKKQISSISASSKELELTKEEYLTFKKHYTASASAISIAEKTGLDVSKVYAAMMNSAKYASAYAN
jgi:hypothetical protein